MYTNKTGRHLTAEHKLKLRLTKLGKKVSQIQLDALRASKQSVEYRKKACDKMKEVWQREDFKKRMLIHLDKIHNKGTNQKISETITRYWREGFYDNSLKMSHVSKGQREMVNFFKQHFPDDNWRLGKCVKLANGRKASLDCYSDSLKVAIEYDGIWHFVDIKQKWKLLSSPNERDILLEKWFADNGWRFIRITDSFFQKDKQHALNLLQKIVYSDKQLLVKIGEEYKNFKP